MKKTPHRDLNPGCLAPQGAMLFGLLVLRWGFWEKLEKREKRLSKRATGSPARRAYRQAHSAFTELEQLTRTEMSLLNQAEDQNFDRYAADFGEAYIFPLLSRPAGFTTDWCGIMHPLGLFKFDSFQSQGNAEALKDASFRRVSEEEEAPTGIFKPVEVGVTAGAKVVNSDGVKTGEMTDYLNNPLDATVENDGSIEFVRENGGEYQLRRGRNNHGQYLVKHFHEAMATSDAKALRALLHYVKFALGDDVSIDYEDISIEGNTARTMFLVDKIYGRSLESEEAQSQESGVAGVDA